MALATSNRRSVSTYAPYERDFVLVQWDQRGSGTAEAYFKKVSAPRKEMVILEGAGHFALATHQQQFLAALREVLSSGAPAASLR